MFKIGWAVHKLLFRVSGGRLGIRAAGDGVGTLFLVTRGRRSGLERRNGLNYVTDGANLAVIASNAGDAADPQWWHNLQATPDAAVEVPGSAGRATRQPVRARRASDPEAVRIWPRFVAASPQFADYATRATRALPVVVLEPR